MIMLLTRCKSTEELMRVLSHVSYLSHDLWINTNTNIEKTPNTSFEFSEQPYNNNFDEIECKLKNGSIQLKKMESRENEELAKHIDEMTDSNGNIIDHEKVNNLLQKMMSSIE